MIISRLTHVIQVLAKHHLGGPLATFGFAHYLPLFSRKKGELPPNFAKHLREAFEELGGAYLKLGQLLAMRPDIATPQISQEFSKLLDEVPPEPFETVKATIEQEFGKSSDKLFSHIDPRPLGSASVSQVHKARTLFGKPVAIKIQRPHLKEQFKEDIEVMRFIAQKLTKTFPELNTPLIIDEFERYTKKELDFTIEASNIDIIKKGTTLKNITIPKVYWDLTTQKIITMDYLEGQKVTQIETPQPKLARELLDTFIEQVFTIGTFHADLHPGNLLLMNHTYLGLLDFGIVGHLDKETRNFGLDLYTAIVTNDNNAVAETLFSVGTPNPSTNERLFNREAKNTLENWQETNQSQKSITHIFHELFNLCSKHEIILPKDIVLLAKGMVTTEATAKYLDSSIDFVTYTEPKMISLLKKQKTSKKIIAAFAKQTKEIAKTLSNLPKQAQNALRTIERGNLILRLDDTKFRHIGKDINLSSNRLSYSLVAASLIVASSLFAGIGPKISGMSIISIIGLAISGFFIGALIQSIRREGKPKYDNHEGYKL